MEIEDQVCSLRLAKKLKELGVKQDSLFYHCLNVKTFSSYDIQHHLIAIIPSGEEHYSAFTVAELGEMLPDCFESCRRYKNDWSYSTLDKDNDINHHSFGETEADSRARMLIYLVENKLIDLKGD
jgi:hypothetical protein